MKKAFKNNRGVELVTSRSSGYETPASFCKPIHAICKLFHFHMSIWIWNLWKERGKITKNLQNEKSFLVEIKNIFHKFWRAIIWWKNKNLNVPFKACLFALKYFIVNLERKKGMRLKLCQLIGVFLWEKSCRK